MVFLQIVLLGFIFGIFAKYADLVNEHGLNEHFQGAGILSGFIWGGAGVGLLVVSPLAGITYIAHVLYWFLKVKLEFYNHAIAGVMILLFGFVYRGDFIFDHRWDLVALFAGYLLTGVVQSYFKNKFPDSAWFWRLRLRIYLVPAAYSLYTQNWEPIVATIFGMMGTELMAVHYRAYSADIQPRFVR